MNKDELKKRMDEIIINNPAPKVSKSKRSIINFERLLNDEQLFQDLSMKLSDIESELIDYIFNSEFNFTGNDYNLIWKMNENKHWSFFIENIKYKSIKKLTDCPDNMTDKIFLILEKFINLKSKGSEGNE